MKAKVVTTITTLLDLDTLDSEHSVEIADEDGLSQVSGDMLGSLLVGALQSTERAVREAYPRAGQAADRVAARAAQAVDPDED